MQHAAKCSTKIRPFTLQTDANPSRHRIKRETNQPPVDNIIEIQAFRRLKRQKRRVLKHKGLRWYERRENAANTEGAQNVLNNLYTSQVDFPEPLNAKFFFGNLLIASSIDDGRKNETKLDCRLYFWKPIAQVYSFTYLLLQIHKDERVVEKNELSLV